MSDVESFVDNFPNQQTNYDYWLDYNHKMRLPIHKSQERQQRLLLRKNPEQEPMLQNGYSSSLYPFLSNIEF